MTCLLRHIVGMDIVDHVLPVLTDHTDEAAISTIKFYRNKIAHASYFSFPDTEFHKICDDVIKASTLISFILQYYQGLLIISSICY